MGLEVVDKWFSGKLSNHLDHKAEFRCRCKYEDCTFTLVNPRLLSVFEEFRSNWGSAIGVTSGFRCQRHNSDVGGALNSWHKKGCALDLFPHEGELMDFYKSAMEYFSYVLLYEDKGFIHVQVEDFKEE